MEESKEVMTLSVPDKDSEPGWDGEPKQTKEEIERQKQLFQWLIDDMREFDASMNEEEKANKERFEDEQGKPEEEGGTPFREAFNAELEKCFSDANASGTGSLSCDEFKAWLNAMNELAADKGMKRREHTDEYLQRCWETFNDHKPDEEGVSYKSCMYVMRYCAM